MSDTPDRKMGPETDWFEKPKSHIPWYVVVAAIGMFVFFFALDADAHTASEIEAWEQTWAEMYEAQPELTHEFDEARFWFEERHACYYHDICSVRTSVVPRSGPSPVTASQGMGNQTSDVERWRGLVSQYFSNVDRALCLIRYESGGNPNARNPSSGAAGLFQVMPFWFDHFGGDRYDPTNNTRVAALVLAEQGWGAWAVVNRGQC